MTTNVWLRVAGLAGAAGTKYERFSALNLNRDCFKYFPLPSIPFWFILIFILIEGVGMGAIGAHAITKKTDEMKEVWKVRLCIDPYISHIATTSYFFYHLSTRLDHCII